MRQRGSMYLTVIWDLADLDLGIGYFGTEHLSYIAKLAPAFLCLRSEKNARSRNFLSAQTLLVEGFM